MTSLGRVVAPAPAQPDGRRGSVIASLRRVRINRVVGYALFVVLILAFGFIFRSQKYILSIGVLSLIFATLAVSLNLTNGYVGMFSIGHAAFYGIGAYTSALVAMRLGMPFPISILAAGLMCAVFGAFLALSTARLRGIYLALTTLAFNEIARILETNLQSITRGPFGLPGIPRPDFGFFKVSTDAGALVIALILLIIAVYAIESLMKSRVGRAFLAIREDEAAAAACGINVFGYKVMAMAIAAFLAGCAGSVYAHYARFISPDSFTLNETFMILSMLVFGGMGTSAGPIVGAFALIGVQEIFRFAATYRMLIYGVVLVLVVLFRPQGILGKAAFGLHGIEIKIRRPKGREPNGSTKV
jgi:branched-chain amino acid transport system permease protein